MRQAKPHRMGSSTETSRPNSNSRWRCFGTLARSASVAIQENRDAAYRSLALPGLTEILLEILTKRVDSGGYNNPAPARFANSNSGPQLGIQPAHDCVSQTDSNAPYARGNAKSRQRNVCEPPFLSCNGKSRVEEAGFQDLPIESCRDGIEQPESSICNRPESEDSARISHRLNEQKRRRVITSQVDILMNLVPVAREYAEKFGRRLDRATILECASEHIRALEANIVSLKARIHELENANHGANSSKIVTSPITDSNM
ncbi:hypothetical protein F1559_004334 [Cyanidiococcus yangmingshanensis]|uniref:BHLH domain-containing protein n=1 Tax=Cyanidiococcus yangmingshanensis TaxID=2690220 RepID=A0A7J7IHK4_9RHOD|nr:hypothetical protein F1559_004334 [Cyanidiococcus yangmingshanensis]